MMNSEQNIQNSSVSQHNSNEMLPAVVDWQSFYIKNAGEKFGRKSMYGDGLLNCRRENMMCRFDVSQVFFIDCYSEEELRDLVVIYGKPVEIWIDNKKAIVNQ